MSGVVCAIGAAVFDEFSEGEVEGFEEGFDHAVELFFADFLFRCVAFKAASRLLSSCACFEGCLFEEELFQVVGGVKICFISARDEHGFDFFAL